MPEKINFTMAALSRLDAPSEGRRWVYDTKQPGLALLITSTGASSFYIYKKINGRPERIRIAGFPEISVDDARDKAKKLISDIVNGDNPAEAKRKQRGELTLEKLFDLYLEFHAADHKKESSIAEDKRLKDRYLAGWSARKLSSIRQSDVQSLHSKIGKKNGKYAANRLLALLSKMFNVATDHGEWKSINPCRGVKMFAEKSRDRFLQPEEVPLFLKAIDELPNQQIADVFRLMLWTGVRKGNVLSMRWDDVDLSASTWRIPDTKANEPQRVHLTAEAVEILTRLKSDANESQFVFPARTAGSKTGHLTDVHKPWDIVREAAGLPGVRMHDLRRTLGSWMTAGGASLPIIGKTLGHKNAATTQIYARLNIDPVREAVNSAVAAMMAAGKTTEEKDGE